jgi:hypothetical protein
MSEKISIPDPNFGLNPFDASTRTRRERGEPQPKQ